MIFYSNIYISAKKLKHSIDPLKIQKKTQRGKSEIKLSRSSANSRNNNKQKPKSIGQI